MAAGASGNPERGTPAIDRSVLGAWLPDDDAAIDAMLLIFRDSATEEFARMRDVLANGDLTEFSRAAHRLRGVALSMGAHELAAVVRTLDISGQAGDARACVEGMTALETQMRLMVAEVPAGSEETS